MVLVKSETELAGTSTRTYAGLEPDADTVVVTVAGPEYVIVLVSRETELLGTSTRTYAGLDPDAEIVVVTVAAPE